MKQFLVFLFLAAALRSQPQCSQTLFTTTTGRQPAITNKTSGCSNWSFQYWSQNVATISIEVDTAPDNGSGLPGSWSAVTPVSLGSNPSTTLFGLIQFTTYAPFVSVNITTLTLTANPGLVSWTLFGVNSIASSKGAGGSSGANVFLSNLQNPTAINQNLNLGSNTLSVNGGNINVTSGGVTVQSGNISSQAYLTQNNCASTSGTCGSAAAGSVTIAAAATTVTVSTTSVHTASEIFLTDDSSKGGTLGVTCNTTTPSSLSVTSITNATSFVITATAPVTNPLCLDYFIVN